VRASDAGDEVLRAVNGQAFRERGVAEGRDADLRWVAVDPARHPLEVWVRRAPWSYARTAQELGAVVVTNGPYMGRSGRAGIVVRFAVCIGAGVLGPRLTARRLAPVVVGATLGAAAGWRLALTDWIPCGVVHSAAAGIDDRRDFRAEGATHAWIGRGEYGFGGCAIGLGHPPTYLREAMGGLLPLVIEGEPMEVDPGAPDFHHDAARARTKAPLVAWALLPLPTESAGSDGVILVVATRRTAASATLAVRLAALGVRDAVATDTSGCAMLVVGRRFLLGPPLPHRQSIQRYGLCCR
jgi:hypothetical protein